jgi:hypothetical protein
MTLDTGYLSVSVLFRSIDVNGRNSSQLHVQWKPQGMIQPYVQWIPQGMIQSYVQWKPQGGIHPMCSGNHKA